MANTNGIYAQAPAYAGGGYVPISNYGSNYGFGNSALSNGMFYGGLSALLGGLFGNPSAPYDAAQKQYENIEQQGASAQQPYLAAGQQGIGNFVNWLNTQQNPSQFINNLMGQYQTSPYAKFQMQQGQNAANNAASASGLLGSTPFMQASQDYAQNISNQDMQNWLSNVLGINTQYGAGQQSLINTGQNAANNLTNMYTNIGNNMAENAYNKEASKQNNLFNTIGGGVSTIGSFFV